MQNSRECVLRTIEFDKPGRIPCCLGFDKTNDINRLFGERINSEFETDILVAMNMDPDFIPQAPGQDQWGCIWETKGNTMGEVVENPVKDWSDFTEWIKRVPDFKKPERYVQARKMREENPDKFIIGGLGFVMMALIGFRGYENYMIDFYIEREKLDQLIDIIYGCVNDSIDRYAEAGMDAVIAWEDWGLQDRLMMNPDLWREVFKVKMGKMIRHVHDKNMKYVLHSCGYIVDILDDLIEIGVDVLQLDQQMLMGLDVLEKYAGRICFFNPVDIQYASLNDNIESIRNYAIEMAGRLSTRKGGFMYKAYAQPASVSISYEVLRQECITLINYNPYI